MTNTNRTIRPERSFNQFSRGAELIRAIQNMWRLHNNPSTPSEGKTERIEALREEFDLTYDEWYEWSDLVRGSNA